MSTATIEREASPVERWLAARRHLIGASDAAAILGEGYKNQSAWTVWANKTGMIQDDDEDDEDESLEIGLAMQPVALKLFTRRTGIVVEDLGEYTIQRHKVLPWMGATLDGFAPDTPDGPAVVEAKNVNAFAGGDWKGEEPPLRVNIQVQCQLECTGHNVAYVVGFIGGNRLIWKRVPRNQRFIDAMLPHLAAFWRLVEQRIPPPIDGSQATAETLKRMYPHGDGATVNLGPEFDRHFGELTAIKETQGRLKTRRQFLENTFKVAIGSATEAKLPDGNSVSWREQHNSGYTVEPFDVRVLRQHKGKLARVEDSPSSRAATATAALLDHGAKLRHASEGGSWYWTLAGGLNVRVSDHEPNRKTADWIDRQEVAQVRVDCADWMDQLTAIVGTQELENE